MKTRFVLVLLFLFISLTGCNRQPQEADEPVKPSTPAKLMFVEYENNVEPYPTRLIVTEQFMRFDDGEGARDFILYDRAKNKIYSVNSDEETVMYLTHQEIEVQPPFALKLDVKEISDLDDAPIVAGESPKHFQFLANGQACFETISVPNLLPDVVKAMQEFMALLSNDSKVTFHTIPADLHDACDMSMDTFSAGRHLEKGFPIQEWTEEGTGRNLVDYQTNIEVDKTLFELPKEYKHYNIQDYREGKVNFASEE